MIEITIGGNKKESVKLAAFRRELIPSLKRGINRATMILAREIKQQLSLGGTYPRGRASRKKLGLPLSEYTVNPGIHLRVVTNALRSSWLAKPAVAISGGVEGRVTTRSLYARIHEYGGKAGRGRRITIPKRPYVAPAIKAKGSEAAQAIVTEITKPLRRAG